MLASPAAGRKPFEPPLSARPAYFRTVEQLRASAEALQREYPKLVEVFDVGQSGEGRAIFGVRIRAGEGARPRLLVNSGTHPREVANPELNARTDEALVRGYGTDAMATHLLDTREKVSVYVLNPDGHVAVEQGYATGTADLQWQRKNRSTVGGVDINRNFPYHFGRADTDANPADPNYPGPHAMSEPETRALVGLVERERPSMYLDLHSQGEKILVPFGDTPEPAPHDRQLRGIAGQLAHRNGYEVQSSAQFSANSGTAKDWAYATFGIPAYTVESGKTYHQQAPEFADTMRRGEPALRYALAIADDPWRRGVAPSADALTVDARAGTAAAEFLASPGYGAVRGAELVLDPATPEGQGIPMEALRSAQDGARVLMSAQLPEAAQGARMVYARALGETGDWGPLVAAWR